MKHVCLLACLLLMAGFATAQAKEKTMNLGNIVSDPASVNGDLGARFGLGAIGTSTAVIEIRLYSNVGFPGSQCTVLRYDKTWKAEKYKLNPRDSAIKTTLKPAIGVESLAKSVLAFNVFALPTQQALNSTNYKLDLASGEVKMSAVNVSDAPCYLIQFKVGDSSREYRYCDPKAYSAFYKGQHEYVDFSNILEAFSKLEIR